ncbi:MAG TPA: hypothetical protein VLV50_16240 [Stellaceae bacterium]|nr:hypothetical protein [Stellaceae bacterium]
MAETAEEYAKRLADEIERDHLPRELHGILLNDRRSAANLCDSLPSVFPATSITPKSTGHRAWEAIGNFYRVTGRFHEALAMYAGLYDQLLQAQLAKNTWESKGTPLVWIYECYRALGYPVIARRYLMLTLVEDAIGNAGNVPAETTGVYFRMVWGEGISDAVFRRYANEMYQHFTADNEQGAYPEWVLQRLDRSWISQVPSPQEIGVYVTNTRYVRNLIARQGDGTGKALEAIADYLFSCMPGCRTKTRQRSGSTDYDVICSVEGPEIDFRSELGRYFVCECKDWQDPADFTHFAKFCRVLDSVKARFGVIFSREGITGEGRTKDAAREQLKIFQDRGIVIVVVDQGDIAAVARGENFISLLRQKYEKVRLDLV